MPSTSLAMVAMFWLRDEARPPVNRVVKVDTRSLMPRPASFSAVSSGWRRLQLAGHLAALRLRQHRQQVGAQGRRVQLLARLARR